jgi:hypothetical protein
MLSGPEPPSQFIALGKELAKKEQNILVIQKMQQQLGALQDKISSLTAALRLANPLPPP